MDILYFIIPLWLVVSTILVHEFGPDDLVADWFDSVLLSALLQIGLVAVGMLGVLAYDGIMYLGLKSLYIIGGITTPIAVFPAIKYARKRAKERKALKPKVSAHWVGNAYPDMPEFEPKTLEPVHRTVADLMED